MGRLFLFYWATRIRRRWWFTVISAAVPAFIALNVRVRPSAIMLAALVGAGLSLWPYCRELARFGWRTRRFQTHSVDQVVIRYAPEIETRLDVDDFTRTWKEALAELTHRFGFPLKRRLVVYLFRTTSDLSRIVRRVQGAGALSHGDAVLMAADYFAAHVVPAEIIRHELCHLFSVHWGTYDPPFKGEGFAVYVQGSIDGKAADFHALAGMLGNSYVHFSWLLEPRIFFARNRYSYALAGSFTDYLIRHYGWAAYQRFFAESHRKTFVKKFERIFQTTLSDAEREWRTELLAQRENLEPELSSAVLEHRLEVATKTWQFYYCIEVSESLLHSANAKARVLVWASHAHTMLGNYRQAAELVERALQKNDPELQIYGARSWLQLGQLRDLLGERDQAIAAYQQSLGEPDWWDPQAGSTHRVARHHLKRPCRERELLKTLGPRRRRQSWP